MANKYFGTQTEKNLAAAFAGESQARNKYTYFASRAKKDGFEQIAAIFQQTADNEKEHAKMDFAADIFILPRYEDALCCEKSLKDITLTIDLTSSDFVWQGFMQGNYGVQNNRK